MLLGELDSGNSTRNDARKTVTGESCQRLGQLEFYALRLPDGPKDREIVVGFKVL